MEKSVSLTKSLSLEILSSKAYLTVNKKLLEFYGPNTAIFLTNLVDKYLYFLEKDMLRNKEWFFIIHSQQIKQTGLTVTEIRSCKSRLKKDEVIKTKLMGIPAKEWYKIDSDVIFSLLEIPTFTRDKEILRQELRFCDGYNNNKYNKKNNMFISNESSKSEGSDFPIVPNLFDKFWVLYPKTAGKGAALTAWTKLCKHPPKQRPTWKTIRKAIKLQKQSERWTYSVKQIPQASTWLNQSRWLDDPTQMKAFKDKDEKGSKIMRAGEWQYLRDDGFYYNNEGRRWIE